MPDIFPPPANPLAPLHEGEALADGVAATLRMTRVLIDQHRQVDLTGLDRMVGLLCARALDLPPDQGRQLRPRLTAILEDLDQLSDALPKP